MPGTFTDTERQRRIHHALDHIFQHLDGPISLQTLAGVAHYSPFHLQKVFKQIIGESPKQYILKLRLETAFHLLVIDPHKSIREISIESGFSSPAVFSRSMKGYFGHSPEQIRELPHRERMRLLHTATPTPSSAPVPGSHPHTEDVTIRILKKEPVKGIYFIAPFDHPGDIQRAFKDLSRIARTHDWAMPGSGLYGILCPHQRNTYKAFLPVNPAAAPDRFPLTGIQGGQFATFTVRGDGKQTNKAAHHFLHRWLPDSGYKIAGVTGYETFSGNPSLTPYYQLERQIHIPIEPAL